MYKAHNVRMDEVHRLTRIANRGTDKFDSFAILDVYDHTCFEISMTLAGDVPEKSDIGMHLLGIVDADAAQRMNASELENHPSFAVGTGHDTHVYSSF